MKIPDSIKWAFQGTDPTPVPIVQAKKRQVLTPDASGAISARRDFGPVSDNTETHTLPVLEEHTKPVDEAVQHFTKAENQVQKETVQHTIATKLKEHAQGVKKAVNATTRNGRETAIKSAAKALTEAPPHIKTVGTEAAQKVRMAQSAVYKSLLKGAPAKPAVKEHAMKAVDPNPTADPLDDPQLNYEMAMAKSAPTKSTDWKKYVTMSKKTAKQLGLPKDVMSKLFPDSWN